MRARVFTIAALFLVLLVSQSAGQIPHTLSYQGVLTDSLGHPKADGTYSFGFRLYSTSSGGSAIWTETKVLTITQGLFSTVLGDQVPINLPFDAPYLLSVQVASDPELTPRIPIVPAGYSFHSLTSDTALYAKNSSSQGGQVVRSINNLKDSVTLAAGNNVTITPSGHTLTIAAGSGFALPYSSSTGNANTLLSLTNTGAGGAASFTVANGADTNAALKGSTNGSGNAISGISLSSTGVYGETGATKDNVAAIKGVATAVSGGVYGILGDASASSGGIGVWGEGGMAGGIFKGSTYGVFGTSNSSTGAEGVTNATYTGASGVLGVAVPSTGNIIGVRGAAVNSSQGVGVQGEGRMYGVAGMTSASASIGVLGKNDASNGIGMEGFADNGSGAVAVWGYSTTGTGLQCSGKFYQGGGVFEAHPSSTTWSTNKPATVKLDNGTKVKLFSEEAAEVYFNDYGEASLQGGRAHIALDPKFVQTVTINQSHPMKVFVQLEGDCKGVYVTNKTVTGFDVVELQSGASNAHFSYRVVCKRKYYEDERLATDEQDVQYNTHVLQTAWPEVIARQEADMARADRSKTVPPPVRIPKLPLPDVAR